MSILRLMGIAGNLDTNWRFQLITSGVATHLRGINQPSPGNNFLIAGDNGVMLSAYINGTTNSLTPIVSGTTNNLRAAGYYSGTGFLDSIYSIAAGVSGVVKGVGYNNSIFTLPTPGNNINGCSQNSFGNNDVAHLIVGSSGYYAYRGFAANNTTPFTTLTSLTSNDLQAIVCNAGSGYKPIVVGVGGTIGMNGGYQTTDFNINILPSSGTVNTLMAVGSANTGTGGSTEALVAVGALGTITSSLNSGFNWSVRSSPTTENLRGVCGPVIGSGNPWVAVGDNGTILTSLDTINWTQLISGISNNLNAIVRGLNNDYVIVGHNGSIYRMY